MIEGGGKWVVGESYTMFKDYRLYFGGSWDLLQGTFNASESPDWSVSLSQDPRARHLKGLFKFPKVVRAIDAARSIRAINLPGWKKVTVDMAHIAERHMTGGPLTAGRTIFANLNEQGVMAAIRQAYGSSKG